MGAVTEKIKMYALTFYFLKKGICQMTHTVPQNMKAAVMHNTREIKIETVPVPDINHDEVLIKVMAVGICGSDLHYYTNGRIGNYVVEKPFILGHECAGEIAAVGSSVDQFKVGDRVAVEPGVTCGRCEACKEGRYNLCPDVQFLATPPVDGAFVQYIKMRQDFVFLIPDSLSYEDAALIEPFSVGIHAAARTKLQPGSTIAIMGMGPVGLMAVAAAKAFGAGRIIVTDLEPLRLEAAKKWERLTLLIYVNRMHLKRLKRSRMIEALMLLGKQQGIQRHCNPHWLLCAGAENWRLSVCLHRTRFRSTYRLLRIMRLIFTGSSVMPIRIQRESNFLLQALWTRSI